MTDAPIGIFDSGVGGLTVTRAIMDQLPGETVHYIGDTANAPYGPMPLAEIRARTLAITDALVDEGLLLLHDFCWDLLNEPTGRWLYGHMSRLGVAEDEDVEGFMKAWRSEHAGLATYGQISERLGRPFKQLRWTWVAYLADEYLEGDPVAKRDEEELLQEERIRAVSFHYAGRRTAH